MGMVSIDAFQVCLELLPNFHGEKPATFCLIFMVKIQQPFASYASQHTKRYSYQAFDVRIRQQGCPIFKVKTLQNFAFGVLWRTGRVLCMCIRCALTCSCCNEPKPFKASSMLICVTYTRKPMSLGDIDQDNHTAMIMHTVQHEYAPTEIALSTYPNYKVKSIHDQRGLLA